MNPFGPSGGRIARYRSCVFPTLLLHQLPRFKILAHVPETELLNQVYQPGTYKIGVPVSTKS